MLLCQQGINMKYKNFLIIILFVTLFQFVPFFYTSAAIGIPCGTENVDPTVKAERISEYQNQHPGATIEEATEKTKMCNFNDIFRFINSGVKFFLTTILLPFVILLVVYAGFLFMTSGANPEARGKAKKIFKNILIGIALILLSWFIVYTIFKSLGADTTRGRAGLSLNNVNWTNRGLLGSVILAQNNTSKTSIYDAKYKVELKVDTKKPNQSIATINIVPSAGYRMSVLLTCTTSDGFTSSNTKSVFEKGTSKVNANINLIEDSQYDCVVENMNGAIEFADSTDRVVLTPSVSGPVPDFKITSTKFSEEFITIQYENSKSLATSSGYFSCKDEKSGDILIQTTGFMVDSLENKGVINFNIADLPYRISEDTNAECALTYYLKPAKSGGDYIKKEEKIKGIINSLTNTKKLNTIFKIVADKMNKDSVTLYLNGSININPNIDVVCVSNGANHKFNGKITFDPTVVGKNKVNNTLLNTPPDTFVSPVTIPVVWNGYGLRPGSSYSCDFETETLEKISGYPDSKIQTVSTTYDIDTPKIPEPSRPKNKFEYPVILGYPRTIFKNYIPPQGPGLITLNQKIPDGIAVPVINGPVVDNGTILLSCDQMFGPNAGYELNLKVSVENTDLGNGYTPAMGKVYSDTNLGPNFFIPITKDPATGFAYSSIYKCLAGFTVSNIPQVRAFMVNTPIYIDPREVGPVVLKASDIIYKNNHMFFNVVASPRIESSVNYTCDSDKGNYNGEVLWASQLLAVKVPVAIPVSDVLPGLYTKTRYKCVLEGTTTSKEKITYQFGIITP